MDIDYPNGNPSHIIGYNLLKISNLLNYYNKIAKLAFDDAKENSNCADVISK